MQLHAGIMTVSPVQIQKPASDPDLLTDALISTRGLKSNYALHLRPKDIAKNRKITKRHCRTTSPGDGNEKEKRSPAISFRSQPTAGSTIYIAPRPATQTPPILETPARRMLPPQNPALGARPPNTTKMVRKPSPTMMTRRMTGARAPYSFHWRCESAMKPLSFSPPSL